MHLVVVDGVGVAVGVQTPGTEVGRFLGGFLE